MLEHRVSRSGDSAPGTKGPELQSLAVDVGCMTASLVEKSRNQTR